MTGSFLSALALAAIYCICNVNAVDPQGQLLLRYFPMVMSHDAATSYLDSKLNVIESYTQTQAPGTLASQLDCGARAFDYRPYLGKDGELIAHHGSVKVNASMRDSVEGIVDWLKADVPGRSGELVVLYTSHCESDGDKDSQAQRCTDATAQLLQDMGVAALSDCAPLENLTVEGAKQMGRVEGGGSLLAIAGCVNENYDSNVNCYGFVNKVEPYCCYGKRKEVAWNTFEAYLNNTAGPSSTSFDNLWMLQAHWQSDAVSIPLGDLHRSSVLQDEDKAGVNKWLAAALRARALPYATLSLVELDNVCDGGNDVREALQEAWN